MKEIMMTKVTGSCPSYKLSCGDKSFIIALKDGQELELAAFFHAWRKEETTSTDIEVMNEFFEKYILDDIGEVWTLRNENGEVLAEK